MRLEVHVLRAGSGIGHLVDGIGFGEACVHIAELSVNIDIDVVAIGDTLVVQDRSVRFHGGFRVEHGRQEFVVDLEPAATFFGRGLGFRHDGGDALAHEARDVVEEVGVVGIDEMVLVRGGRVELARYVLPGEHGDDAGHGQGRIALDRLDARMRMRRAQHLEMQHPLHWRHVERIVRSAGNDRLGVGAPQARAAGMPGDVLLGVHHAVQRIVDGMIAGAAAEIALEPERKVLARLFVEGRRGHDHAGRAEAALEGLRVEEGLLHRMKHAVLCEAFNRSDRASLGAKGGDQAAVKRNPVEPHGAGATIALVAAFLDPEPSLLAQESAQALARRGLRRKHLAVDGEVHRAPSSARICSA